MLSIRSPEYENIYPKMMRALISIVILGGILIRFSNLLKNPSLWLDEAMLSYNIINVDAVHLFKPLPYFNQSSPLIFLYLVKFFGCLGANSEYFLRATPLLADIVTLILLSFITLKYFSPFASLISTLLLAFNPLHLRYSIEVKHYSTEALSIIVILYFTLDLISKNFNSKTFYKFGVIGAILLWISNVAVLGLFASGLTLIIYILREKEYIQRRLKYLFIVGGTWFLSFLLNYFTYSSKSTENQFILYKHIYEKGYMPLESIVGTLSWLKRTLFGIISHIYPLKSMATKELYILGVVALIAMIVTMLKYRHLAMFFFSFWGVLITLSCFRVFPLLPGRYSLFLLPPILLVIGIGIGEIGTYVLGKNIWLKRFYFMNYSAVRFILVGILLLAILQPTKILVFNAIKYEPFKEETRPLIERYYTDNKQKNVPIFVYYAAQPMFEYYSREENISYLGKISFLSGSIWVNEVRKKFTEYIQILQKVAQEKGELYVLFSHTRKEEHDNMIKALEKIGSVQVVQQTRGAILYYFNVDKDFRWKGEVYKIKPGINEKYIKPGTWEIDLIDFKYEVENKIEKMSTRLYGKFQKELNNPLIFNLSNNMKYFGFYLNKVSVAGARLQINIDHMQFKTISWEQSDKTIEVQKLYYAEIPEDSSKISLQVVDQNGVVVIDEYYFFDEINQIPTGFNYELLQ